MAGGANRIRRFGNSTTGIPENHHPTPPARESSALDPVRPGSGAGIFTAAVFWSCARHPAGESRDIQLLERLVWLLPFLAVPLAFATVFVPGAKNWWWLERTVMAITVALCLCGGRVLHGFGSGSKGQDGGIIVIFMFALILVSLGMAISGAMILAETRPGFDEWFRARRVIGSVLTLLAAVPIGLVVGFVAMLLFAVVVGIWTEFLR